MPTVKKLYQFQFFDKNVKIKSRADKNKWLNEFVQCGSITDTCKKRGISRQTYYDWMKNDAVFARVFKEEVRPMVVSLLEDEAYRRAVKGINKGVYYRGEKVAVEKEYSDSLLALLLRANAPDKYKQVVDSTVKNDITIKNTALADALAERMSKANE